MACSTGWAANNPVPFIDPPTVPLVTAPGGAGFNLTVNGAGFVNGSVVNWNGSPRTTAFVSAGQVTAAILASDITIAGTASITVSNPAPGGGRSNVVYFGVTSPAGAVTVAGVQIPAFLNMNTPIVTDLNHDGKLDLILFVENEEGETNPYVALGNGDGTFQPLIFIPAIVETSFLALADFNNDGNLDIAFVTPGTFPTTITILLGNGDGTFQFATGTGVQSNTSYAGLIVGDFNQDGNLDIVANYVNGQDIGISLLFGNGDGTFQSPVNDSLPYPYGCGSASDYSGDGKLDLLCFSQSSIAVLPGNGDGTFQPAVTTSYQRITGIGITGGSLYDVNGDGKIDLIFGYAQDHPPEFWSQVLLGNGDGTFQAPFLPALGIAAIPPGDFNGDGKLDFVSTTTEAYPFPADELSIWAGNGDGTFGNPVAMQTSTGLPLTPLVQGDFNGDGTQDLLAEDSKGGFWLFLQGSFRAGNPSPPSLSFGQAIDTISPGQILTLANTGNLPLTLSGTNITGTNGSEFQQTNDCPASLAVGANCQITVAFSPAAIGTRSATLNVPNNGIGNKAVVLSGAGTDFSISEPAPNSVTVAAGQTAIYTFEVDPQNGFKGGVSLSCSGTPAGANCLPALATLDGSSGIKVAYRVATTARTSAMNQSRFSKYAWFLACGLFGLPLVVSMAEVSARRHRAHLYRLTFLLLIVVAMSLVPGCGGVNGGGNGSGTPAGTYLLTVAGRYTSGGETLTHTTTLMLVVE